MPEIQGGQSGSPRYRHVSTAESVTASRRWWEADSAAYLNEHGDWLDSGLIWGPEGFSELEGRLLGPDVRGLSVLEVGCGAAHGSRWLAAQGAQVVGLDIAMPMLRAAQVRDAHTPLPYVQASGHSLPFADASFDAVFSAHGAYGFLPDLAEALSEARRVIVPNGLVVFAVTHPVRWAFADDPGPEGLVAQRSYFDRRAYVEVDELDRPVYVEHHRTLGDTVQAIRAAELILDRLVEPEWPDDHEIHWGGWSRLRGELLPGTAILVCRAAK
jgi:SAM-dependent methyltransferase